MSFYVYVITNSSLDKIYIGQTADLQKRLDHHNGLLPRKKTSFTAKNGTGWRVVYSEEFPTRSEARGREKELKSFRGREFIKTKIK